MKTYDFIGIGIGPFNLSIAALAEGLDGFSSLFLERKPHFSWHPGMMVPDCHMQTSFLKDLVSAVEPTNRHSFLNYLVQRKFFNDTATAEIYTVIKAETVGKFLPVYDNLERALAQETADEAYKKGVEMTMNQLVKVMEGLGVTSFGEIGEVFDPARHNAVMHVEQEGLGENVIAEVFQKGFLVGEKVIRFAMVKVAN